MAINLLKMLRRAAPLKVLLQRDASGMWTTQMLRWDIGSQGETQELALSGLEQIFSLEKKEGLGAFPSAPKRFHTLWESGTLISCDSCFNVRVA